MSVSRNSPSVLESSRASLPAINRGLGQFANFSIDLIAHQGKRDLEPTTLINLSVLRKFKMANTRQSTKRAALADKRQAQNTIIRSATKTTIRNAVEAINGKDPALAKTAFLAAVSALGHAASKGAIPKTRAARKTSRLTLFTKKVHPAALA